MHADRGGLEGVFGREEKRSPVLSSMIRRVFRPGYDVMPLKNVGFGWVRCDVRRRVF